MDTKLTQNKLKEIVTYDPSTGIFTRTAKANKKGFMAGMVAGSKDGRGYISFSIGNKKYRSHRLAFLWMEGYLPENVVDHIDRIKTNNKWENLREVSRTCNIRNCGGYSHNTSGCKGVCFSPERKQWVAMIVVNNKGKFLGRYKDFADAVCARFAAEQCLGWGQCDSKSQAHQYVENMLMGRCV